VLTFTAKASRVTHKTHQSHNSTEGKHASVRQSHNSKTVEECYRLGVSVSPHDRHLTQATHNAKERMLRAHSLPLLAAPSDLERRPHKATGNLCSMGSSVRSLHPWSCWHATHMTHRAPILRGKPSSQQAFRSRQLSVTELLLAVWLKQDGM
jgi:hypothetical protein